MVSLEELRSASIEEFFLAVIVTKIDWDDAHNVKIFTEDYPNGISAIKALQICIEEALVECGEEITEARKKEVEEDVKRTITTQLEKAYPVMLLKKGEIYIDLSEMNVLDTEVYQVRYLTPFAQYYKREDFDFEEDECGIYLNIELEPFFKFENEHM